MKDGKFLAMKEKKNLPLLIIYNQKHIIYCFQQGETYLIHHISFLAPQIRELQRERQTVLHLSALQVEGEDFMSNLMFMIGKPIEQKFPEWLQSLLNPIAPKINC